MTEDQIKAIAEEYARQNPPSTTDEILKREVTRLNARQVFEPFLRFLDERYSIIEREKVIGMYEDAKKSYYGSKDPFSSMVGLIRCDALRQLFSDTDVQLKRRMK